MRFLVASLAVLGSVFISGSEALTASTIAGCPALAARAKAATSVADLRPDDIKVVGALGDRYENNK
jgi:phospholipase B1